MISTNSIQTFKLIYSYNVVKESIAYIFINTECNGLPYKNDAKNKGKKAYKIFSEVLEFTEVNTFTNLPRDKIIEKLKNLEEHAKEFAKNSRESKQRLIDQKEEIQQRCIEEFKKMVKMLI